MAALRAIKFGPPIAANLRRRRSPPTGRWRLDEMVVQIRGWRMYLWRAVDDEGEVLDVLVQGRRKRRAALKRLRRLLKNQGVHPRASSRTSWPRIAPRYGTSVSPAAIARAECGKPRRKRAPGHPTTRAEAAEVQVSGLSPKVPVQPRRDLQHVQHSDPLDPPSDPSPPQG